MKQQLKLSVRILQKHEKKQFATATRSKDIISIQNILMGNQVF